MMIKQTLLVASLGLLFAGNALALDNGNFSSGLTGWNTLGDVAVQSGSVLMTTASVDYADDSPAAVGAFNASGVAAAEIAAIEASLGLAAYALDLNEFDSASEGSLLKQIFNVNAGDTLSFDWNFFTNEGVGADYAFVSINGNVTTLASAAAANVADVTYAWSTGVASFSQVFAAATTVDLAFGVVDRSDYTATSALTLDNVTVIAAPVPEADTYALMGLGLGLVSLLVRRRKA